MLLYILRHADADTVAANDDDRPLSEKGHKQAQTVASFCARHQLKPALILTSPLPRADQTAQHVAEELKVEKLVVPWLRSGMQAVAGVDELSAYRARPSVMIVGHEPDLSSLIAHLLGVPSNSLVHIRKASLTAVQIEVYRAAASRLEFSIPCKLI